MAGSCQNCLYDGLLRVSMKENEYGYESLPILRYVVLYCIVLYRIVTRRNFEMPVLK